MRNKPHSKLKLNDSPNKRAGKQCDLCPNTYTHTGYPVYDEDSATPFRAVPGMKHCGCAYEEKSSVAHLFSF